MQTRDFTDKQGNKRTAYEIVADEVTFVGGKETPTESENKPVTGQQTYMPPQYMNPGASAPFEDIPDDGRLPF